MLLEMLPPDSGRLLNHSRSEVVLCSRLTGITQADVSSVPKTSICCDSCTRITTDEHYRCSVCCEGDFDLCLDRIAEGVHCFDVAHKLSCRVCRDGKLISEPNAAEEAPTA